jgi:hypothetical protein
MRIAIFVALDRRDEGAQVPVPVTPVTPLKQTQSPPSALSSGQEHAPAPGRTRGFAPGPPDGPAPSCSRPRKSLGNPPGVRIPLRALHSSGRHPAGGALSRFVGVEPPRLHRTARVCAAQGLRRRGAGVDPTPPTVKNRTWLCLLAARGTNTLRFGVTTTSSEALRTGAVGCSAAFMPLWAESASLWES